MSEIAEMMLDGTLCEGCGEYIGTDADYPQYCSSECAADRGVYEAYFAPIPHFDKVACPICDKLCGGRGLTKNEGVHQHMRDAHGKKKKQERDRLLGVRHD